MIHYKINDKLDLHYIPQRRVVRVITPTGDAIELDDSDVSLLKRTIEKLWVEMFY